MTPRRKVNVWIAFHGVSIVSGDTSPMEAVVWPIMKERKAIVAMCAAYFFIL